MITTIQLVTQSTTVSNNRRLTLLNSLPSAGQILAAANNQAVAASLSAIEATEAVASAEIARDEAESARDAALIQAGVYASTSAGLAAVSTGQYFKVAGSGNVAATEYKKAVSPNLFDTSAVQANKYVSSADGTIQNNTGWGCSGFIPVTPGQSYTISGTRGRHGLAFFSAASAAAVVAGSYNGTTTLPLTVTAPAGAAYMVINLYSATAGTYSNVQVEAGTVATAYSAYGTAIAQQVTQYPSVDSVQAIGTRVTALEQPTDYEQVVSSVNLFDTATVRAGKFLNSTTGAIQSATGWGCSAFIPVTAGQKYTISGTRGRQGVAFYTSASDSAVVSGSYNNSTDMPLTVTAPAGATHMAINLYSATAGSYSNIQVEAGISASDYIPYGGTKKYVKRGSVYPLEAASLVDGPVLVLGGTGNAESYVEVTRDGKVIKRTFRPFPAVSQIDSCVFDFRKDYIDGVLIKSMGDDVAPYRALGTTIGANHGFYMFRVTATGHGKVQADIGSIYSNGGVQWVLIGIVDANTLYLARRASNISTAAPAGTYTYVSGGSGTSNITVASTGSLEQLYPPFINRSMRVIVDGVEVVETTATLRYSREVVFVESYDIIEYADVISWYEASGAGGGIQPTGTPAISVSISYAFDHEANCTIYTDFLARKSGLALQDIMFLQAGRLNTGVDGAIEYYIPKALPVTHEGTPYDYANIDSSDTSGWSARLDFTPVRCEASGILCDRLIQLSDTYGFAMGYLPVQSTGVSERRTQATVKALQISTSSGKVYLSAIDKGNITLNAGDYFSTIAYRNLIVRSAARTCCYAVRTNGQDYLYVDWHSAGVDRVPVPADMVGRSFEVVEKSANVTVLSQALTNSLVVNVANTATYGYLILKVT